MMVGSLVPAKASAAGICFGWLVPFGVDRSFFVGPAAAGNLHCSCDYSLQFQLAFHALLCEAAFGCDETTRRSADLLV